MFYLFSAQNYEMSAKSCLNKDLLNKDGKSILLFIWNSENHGKRLKLCDY